VTGKVTESGADLHGCRDQNEKIQQDSPEEKTAREIGSLGRAGPDREGGQGGKGEGGL
jgi:hypothetical protein